MDETREIDIDLQKIFYMMRTKIIYIILITMFTGVLVGLYTHFFIDPVYTASCSMCVYNNPEKIDGTGTSNFSNNDITASQDLVKTYVFVLKSNSVMDKVAEELGYDSGDKIKGYVTASSEEATFILKVKVACTDPQLATDIANAIAKVAPTEMAKGVGAGGVNVIDTAKLPKSPTSPNLKKNVLIGLIAGFVLSFAAFFIYEMFDTTITNAKDLERDFELPVLGTVPMLEAVSDDDDEEEPPVTDSEPSNEPIAKPSPALLENIQSMKGDAKNDKA